MVIDGAGTREMGSAGFGMVEGVGRVQRQRGTRAHAGNHQKETKRKSA